MIQDKKAAAKEEKKKDVTITNSRYSDEEESDEECESPGYDEVNKIRKKMTIPRNTWIIKPGENTNRGNGIDVCKNLGEVK